MVDDHSHRLRAANPAPLVALVVLAVLALWAARNVHFSLEPIVPRAELEAAMAERDAQQARARAAEAQLEALQAQLEQAQEAQQTLTDTVARHSRDLKRLGGQVRTLRTQVRTQKQEEVRLRNALAAATAPEAPGGPPGSPADVDAEAARHRALEALGIPVAQAGDREPPQAELRLQRTPVIRRDPADAALVDVEAP